MIPVHFGTGERRLFGLYTPARAAGSGGHAVVLCHPWGQEYLRAHRSVRQLATMLSSAGFHVFQFDYYGTGDSSGEGEEGDIAGWNADIGSAIEELKDTTGVSRVVLAGLRLGGALAACVAVQQPKLVEGLVLWDPVLSGPEYLRELRRDASPPSSQEGVGSRGERTDEAWEVRGFPVTQRLVNDLQTLDVTRLAGVLPKRTLLVTTGGNSSLAAMKAALVAHHHPATIEEAPAPPAWLEERNLGAGAIPVTLLQRIVKWLS